MQKRKFGNTGLEVAPVGLGTWVFGGWPWNEVNEADCERTLEKALALGVNLIDTAPFYGFGRSETIIGRTLKRLGAREKIILATKQGLSWDDNRRVGKDGSKKAVLREIDESLRRLQTDWIDIYQVHWPDPNVPIGETMEAFLKLKEHGKIRVIGVSNFNLAQIEEALRYAPVESLQPPYNYWQRESEKEILPVCVKKNIGTLTYGTLCRGILTGKFSKEKLPNDPIRQGRFDPFFTRENLAKVFKELPVLQERARSQELTLAQWGIQWSLGQPGVTVALVGARAPQQIEENAAFLNR